MASDRRPGWCLCDGRSEQTAVRSSSNSESPCCQQAATRSSSESWWKRQEAAAEGLIMTPVPATCTHRARGSRNAEIRLGFIRNDVAHSLSPMRCEFTVRVGASNCTIRLATCAEPVCLALHGLGPCVLLRCVRLVWSVVVCVLTRRNRPTSLASEVRRGDHDHTKHEASTSRRSGREERRGHRARAALASSGQSARTSLLAAPQQGALEENRPLW
jgi:hypothetical protein